MASSSDPSISAGDVQSFAIRSDGALLAWGLNNAGQLGNGHTSYSSSVPTQVDGKASWKAVSAGGQTHALAIRSDGTLWAWGEGGLGQLGDGACIDHSSPMQIGNDVWKSVSAGEGHSFGIRVDGSLWAWGYNAFGELGDGTHTMRTSPVPINPGTTWKAISTSQWSTLALRSDGTLWAWGDNGAGQLGDGTVATGSLSPEPISPGFTWTAISIGGQHSLAIRSDGTLWAWGGNVAGQFGDETTLSPAQIGSRTDWEAISAGGGQSYAICSDGTLWVWGSGSLGNGATDGATVDSSNPVQIDKGVSWKAVSACDTGTNALALRSDGTLWSWGSNDYGQLGNGTTTSSLSPVQIGDSMNWGLPESVPLYDSKTIQLPIYSHAASSDTGTVALEWGSSLFAGSARDYHHNIAKMACALSEDAYDENTITKAMGSGPNSLNLIGLSPQYYDSTAQDTVAFVLGHQTIGSGSDAANLVVVVIRGTHGQEWYGDFDFSPTDQDHTNFAIAKREVHDALASYINDNNLADKPLKILITGHSRGAAVANLLAADIDASHDFTSRDNVYAYTFATPNVTTNPAVKKSADYDNIFNIENPEDFVPYMPLPSSGWNYWKYGQTLAFPTAGTNSKMKTGDYATKYGSTVSAFFYLLTGGKSYDSYEGYTAVQGFVHDVQDAANTPKEYWNTHYPTDAGSLTPADYFNKFAGMMADGSPTSAIGWAAWCVPAGTLTAWPAGPSLTVYSPIGGFMLANGNPLTPKMTDGHTPETYLSWMLTVNGEDELLPKLSGKYARIACPVDVKIFDDVGTLVGQTTGDEVALQTDGVAISIGVGDVKNIFLPDYDTYRIEMVGTDTGQMDYSVENVDGFTGDTSSPHDYQNVALTEGKTFTSTIDADYTPQEVQLQVVDDGVPMANVHENGSETPIRYTVNFDSDGGTAVAPAKVLVGDSVGAPVAPTKTGFVFAGWYVEGAGTSWNFVNPVTTGMTLVAKWTPLYTLTVNGENMGSYKAGDRVPIDAGSAPAGKVFAGWTSNPIVDFADAISLVTTFVMPDGPVSISATWKDPTPPNPDPHEVIVGGKSIGSYKAGDSVPINAGPAPANKVFAGWTSDPIVDFADATNPVTTFVMPDGPVTIMVTWKDITFAISFDAGGGSAVDSQTIVIGGKITEPAIPTKTGFAFRGWSADDGLTTWNFATGTVLGDMVLTAQWVPTHTVTINGVDSAIQYAAGDSVPVDAGSAPQGKVFAGWRSDPIVDFADATSPTTTFIMPDGSVSVTATWKDPTPPNSDPHEVIVGGKSVGSYKAGENVPIDAGAAPKGKVFAGWTSNPIVNFADATSPVTTFVMPDGPVTITATWKDATYTVSFDSKGGSAVSSQVVVAGNKITKPVAPTRAGYTFAGWYAEGASKPWDFDTPVTADMTLTAHWSSAGFGGSGGTSNSKGSGGDTSAKAKANLSNLPLTGDTSSVWQIGAILLLAIGIGFTAVFSRRNRRHWV